ncbi:hypothetical protein [Paraburkholderia sp. J8-2]|uniref:hypothetical protein n=1 Tax=Paraburkholderia sp. J8-2 TaxID=2805440 RepID=UPI002AB74E68|nr:hypothetical protein [Paraburkholderia sp. J8-2]
MKQSIGLRFAVLIASIQCLSLASASAFAAGVPVAASAPQVSPTAAHVIPHAPVQGMQPAMGDFGPSNSDQYAAEQARLPYLEVRAKAAQLEAQIAQANWQAMHPQTGGAAGTPGTAVVPYTGAAPTVVAPAIPVAAAPEVASRKCTVKMGMCAQAINGFGSSGYRAVIAFGGGTQEVGVGDSINGGWVVGSISDAFVHLTRGHASVDLEP